MGERFDINKSAWVKKNEKTGYALKKKKRVDEVCKNLRGIEKKIWT